MTTLRRFARAAALYGALAAGACGDLSLSPDPDIVRQADAAFADLAAGRDAEFAAKLPEGFQTPTHLRTIGVMRQMLPPTKPEAPDVIGWHSYAGTGGSQITLTMRYDYPSDEHITAVAVYGRKGQAPWRLDGFHVQPSAPGEVEAEPLKVGPGKAAKTS